MPVNASIPGREGEAMNKVAAALEEEIVYPESDGQPMSDNTKQFVWIVLLYGNLAAQYRDDENVFVGGNQNWFPRQGEPDLSKAPDVYVVFGRPKGHRSSWKQWLENDVPLTVVFEVLSPKNTHFEMVDKLQFYDEFGVEEYYVFDPDTNRLAVYLRGREILRLVHFQGQFVSPRLGIRFDLTGPEMVVFHPDGRRFLSFEELDAERRKAEQRADRMAALMRKVLEQQATPEEAQELQELLRPAVG
jgi:Uma2 family endonuclease